MHINPHTLWYLFICTTILPVIFALFKFKKSEISLQKITWYLIFFIYLSLLTFFSLFGSFEVLFTNRLHLRQTTLINPTVEILLYFPLGIYLAIFNIGPIHFKTCFKQGLFFIIIIHLLNIISVMIFNPLVIILNITGHFLGLALFIILSKFFNTHFVLGTQYSVDKKSYNYLNTLMYLSLLGVFLFYWPHNFSNHFSATSTPSVNIISTINRNMVLIPADEIEDEIEFYIPAGSYVIFPEDIEGEFFGGSSLCYVLGECFEGSLVELNYSYIILQDISRPDGFLIEVDRTVENPIGLAVCNYIDSEGFILCTTYDTSSSIDWITAQNLKIFELSEDVILSSLLIDSFGEKLERQVGFGENKAINTPDSYAYIRVTPEFNLFSASTVRIYTIPDTQIASEVLFIRHVSVIDAIWDMDIIEFSE